MVLAVLMIRSGPVDLIRKGSLRIVAIPGFIGLSGLAQYFGFVVRIERDLLDSSHAVFIKAQIKLDSELHRCLDFAADDRADVRLGDAYEG